MPANSARIRITVWLNAEEYHGMHELSTRLDEKHAPFVRRAVRNEIARIRKRGESRRTVAVESIHRTAKLA